MSAPNEFDVSKALEAGAKFTVSNAEDPVDRKHRHWMERFWGIVGSLITVAIIVLAAVMAFKATDGEIRKGGVGLLGAVLTGILGFLAGRGSK